MQRTGKFSVLTSVYQREKVEYMQLAFESIFNQTICPSEVILVLDGPLTPELYTFIDHLASEHPEVKLVKCDKNQGLGKALRIGLEECTYDIVARMDTDDICKPDRFEKQLAILNSRPDVDVCGAWIDEFLDTPNRIVSMRKMPQNSLELYDFGKKRNPVNHPVAMFRKKAVQMNGNYQDYPLFEDYFLWARMLKYGCQFYCIQESLLYFRSNKDMLKRRGGMHYAKEEIRFELMLYGIRYINFWTLLYNVSIRLTARIMPNSIRNIIYGKIRK